MKTFQLGNLNGCNGPDPMQNDPLKCRFASSIIGNDILNPASDVLGRISDVMIDIIDGKVEYLVIESFEFLGKDQRHFAVPIQALSPAKEYGGGFILNETTESLKRHPELEVRLSKPSEADGVSKPGIWKSNNSDSRVKENQKPQRDPGSSVF